MKIKYLYQLLASHISILVLASAGDIKMPAGRIPLTATRLKRNILKSIKKREKCFWTAFKFKI
ncbi:hypothetical protein DT075_34185 [Bacillus licheniformis]|nr:hypothetical protein DT075_34185 [Bacillus licheniformis]